MASLLSVNPHRASFHMDNPFPFLPHENDDEDEITFRPKSFSGPPSRHIIDGSTIEQLADGRAQDRPKTFSRTISKRIVDGSTIEQLADGGAQNSFFVTVPKQDSPKKPTGQLTDNADANNAILNSKITNHHLQPPVKRQRPARFTARKAENKTENISLSQENESLAAPTEPTVPSQLQTCLVCSEDFAELKISIPAAGACSHKTKTCGDCSSSWIASQIETVGWDQIRCPECPRLLSYGDIKSAASNEVFQK
jgi:hypothetical protein